MKIEREVNRMGVCQYPQCRNLASTTWARVPLCDGHYESIRAETVSYYRSSTIKYSDRPHYLKIARLIPWSLESKGEVLPDGSNRWD